MSPKICIFTQTYSNDREILYKYHNMDELDVYFRNQFDLNLYSFHNVSNEIRIKLLNNPYFLKIKNLEVIQYDNITYTRSWEETLKKLKSEGYEKIIFIQDDCFTSSSKDKIDFLIKYIKNGDYKLLNIERNIKDLKSPEKKIIYDDFVKVYDTKTSDYDGNGYSFDDGPFVGNIDFLLENVYDEIYYNSGSVWLGELYLHKKMQVNIIDRYITNYPCYLRYKITGGITLQKKVDFDELEKLENYFKLFKTS
jgi:hypothetical protein